ncbi:hypothetical protein OAK09_02610, partial [Candidatus Marinimicrobia bacterium]|nr:hypothetical protein [Candidatus Neomarinimicrobiota bacterium]
NPSLSNNINPGMNISGGTSYVNSSYPNGFAIYNDKLFFNASDTLIGNELFYYDGTNITGIDLYEGSSTNGSYTNLNGGSPYYITVYKDALYFEGNSSAGEWELYSYDLTNGYRLVKDLAPGTYTSGTNTYQNQGHPHNLTIFDNKLYFSGQDGYNVTGGAGDELWYYGGNNAGRVTDIYPGSSGSYPYAFYATTDKMYFKAQASSTGSEPYVLTSLDPFPSIASVTSTTADGSYKTGDEINITVNFSEAVTLSSGDSMTVTLETGSTDRTVIITSISSATSASGSYTVQAGDVSSDLNVKSITVSGALYDNSEQLMEDYSIASNLSSSKAIVVDGLNPRVASIKSTSTNTTYGTGAEINITVNFSEAVSLSSSGSMTITLETGDTDRTVSITSISSATSASGTYTVQEGDGSSDLSVNSIALSSGTTIKDAVGNAMSDFSVPADSNLSDFNAIIINTTKPSTPLGFVVSSNYGSVGLAWTEISGATYKIYRSTSATSDFASLSALSTNSYTDTPSEVKRYYYYVTSVNNLGESNPSDTLHGYPSEIWYVEMDGSDSNDGKSKAKAFKTIEQAVKNDSLVSGDTIYVGPSISSSKTRDQSGGYYDFGGISGGINLGHTKDFVLIGTSGADSTIFNAEGKNRHFTFYDGQTAATQIIDITFYNGEDNSWPGGGSIAIRNSATKLQFVNCVFDSNRVTKDYQGGAIEIRDQALPSFIGCTFKNNYVLKSTSGSQGGAVFISSPNSEDDLNNAINFKQCTFIGNYSKGKQSTYGGAVYAYKNTVFENCLFVKNGAIAGWGQSANTWENSRGGAIWSGGGSGNTGITTAVVNCTFDSNYVEVLTSNGSPAGSDIFYGYGSNNQTMKAYVFNTVITGSYHLLGGAPAYTNTNEKQYRIFYTEHTDNRIYVDYSAIEGSADQSWADDNVFDIIPVYTDRSNGDYSINNLSPVIGQGTSSFESISAPSIDILGASRPSSNPDMGAYENSLASSDAPLPLSGIVGTAKTNSVYLTWPSTKSSLSSTSDAANIQYLIYQGGSQVGTSLNTSFTVSSLTNGATYSFKVAAQDTITTITGAPSRAISITPTYTGPYWYVASSGGSSSNTVNADLGSREVPLNHMSSAIESAAAGDTIVMMKGT